jgi:hypothetical protein
MSQDTGRPWWDRFCIICDVQAAVGDDGERLPPRWWPPMGRPGGIYRPKATNKPNKPIEYRPPTPGQRRQWEDLLRQQGRERLESAKKTLQKTLEIHYRKLAEIYQKGGFPNKVEETILTLQNDLEVIVDLLGKAP